MFSFASSRAHAERKRILASAYSKTAISQKRVQDLIKARTSKVTRFFEKQTSSDTTFHGNSGPVVIRNVFRALQSDVFTAFAFSDLDGTRYLDNLKKGPNTLEDLGMDDMDLFHDERRDKFFFWESESPFKYVGGLIGWDGPEAHERAQIWLSKLVRRHENRSSSDKFDRGSEKQMRMFNTGVYDKLLFWRSQGTGQPLDWKERASEIMDHAG